MRVATRCVQGNGSDPVTDDRRVIHTNAWATSSHQFQIWNCSLSKIKSAVDRDLNPRKNSLRSISLSLSRVCSLLLLVNELSIVEQAQSIACGRRKGRCRLSPFLSLTFFFSSLDRPFLSPLPNDLVVILWQHALVFYLIDIAWITS